MNTKHRDLMTTSNLEQGSQEWLAYRLNKVGASEIANLFNANPFTRAEDQTKYLLGLKLGFNTIFTSAAMRAGNDNEDRIIAAVEGEYGIVTQPLIGHLGRVSASFDGITLDHDLVVEVKYSDHTYNFVKENGFAPPHYEMQVQQQLLVSGAEKGIFAAMNTKTGEVIYDEIYPNKEFHDKIIDKVDAFFDLLESKEWQEDDFNEERDDLDWLAEVQDYKDALSMENEAKAAKAAAKKALIDLSDGIRTKGGGCIVYPSKGRETINYKQIVSDNKIEIDPKYKKQGASSWGIRVSDK